MDSAEKRVRHPFAGKTAFEVGEACLKRREVAGAEERKGAFQELVGVATCFVDRAERFYGGAFLSEIDLYDDFNDPFGFAAKTKGEVESITIVYLSITSPEGRIEQYGYPVVRTGTYDEKRRIMPLAVAVEDGPLFPLTRKPGFSEFDLSTKSLPTSYGKRYLLRDGISLDSDPTVSEYQGDTLRVGDTVTLMSGWKISVRGIKYSKHSEVFELREDGRLLQATLLLTDALADGQPVRTE